MGSVGPWRWSFAAVVCGLLLLASQVTAEINFESCLESCGDSGCVGHSCLPSCRLTNSSRDAVLQKLPAYPRWKEWVCSTECRYHCKLSKETEEAGLDQEAIGYKDNWCLARVMVHQQSSHDLYSHLAKSAFKPTLDLGLIREPASTAFSALNLVANLIGLFTFLKLVYLRLPLHPISRGPTYPYTWFWTFYGILTTTYWSAQCIIRSRDMAFDKHIDATLEVVLALYGLILAITRVGDMRSEQSRVVVISATVPALVPHLFYINLCTFDYGLNILVCLAIGAVQYLLWITWAVVTKHPAQLKIWVIVLLAPLALFLRFYDFSGLWEFLDPDSLWILSTVPSSILWWSFAKSDAEYRTNLILEKRAKTIDPKKKQ